jgi:hypothetical protein
MTGVRLLELSLATVFEYLAAEMDFPKSLSPETVRANVFLE